MYFVVAGAGEVGFHLSQALLEAGHEVTVIEADRRRATFVQERLGSIVLNAAADEGRAQMEAGRPRPDAGIALTRGGAKNPPPGLLAKGQNGGARGVPRGDKPQKQY